MCFHLPALSPSFSPGQRAEQAGGRPAAHPEPVRNLPERQQERQRHAAEPLCGSVSGELLAAPAGWNHHAHRWHRREHSQTLGARCPPPALTGRRDQKSQEKAAGASQREDQDPAGVFEE